MTATAGIVWRALGSGLFVFSASQVGCAQTSDQPVSVSTFNDSATDILKPRFSGNLRLRYEFDDDNAAPLNANALTLRFLGSVEATLFKKTTILGEIEANGAIVNQFNDGTGNMPDRPLIPDPDGFDLNRLQITTELIPKTRITAGRQRIALDDERFIAQSVFRQQDRTFDGVRVTTNPVGDILVDLTYFRQANQPLGGDNPNGQPFGDSFLVNLNIPTPVGRLAGFHYALDLANGPPEARNFNASSQTSGARLVGRKSVGDAVFLWEASYARQTSFANNPNEFSADYYLGSLQADYKRVSVRARGEVLGDGGTQSFQTPLGALHRFNGFADVFMTTPPDGLVDVSLFGVYRFGTVGNVTRLRANVRHHWFEAESVNQSYGTEWNATLAAEYKRTNFSITYANYRSDGFATDAQNLFLTVSRSF